MLVVAQPKARVKCVVVDCDNTLWQGVIREDGPENLKLDRTRMQRLWHLGLRGIPIALCSKNDPEDEALILDTLRSYGQLHEKVVATRFNWLPKSVNIQSIAEQLNIGLDTIAFFDDNPAERAEVAEALPEVHVFPETAIAEAPDWFMFHPSGDLSTESLSRVQMYREESQRSAAQAEFGADTDAFARFLHSSELRLETREAKPSELSRVAELLVRTNQLNATLKRLEAAEVVGYHESDRRAVHIVKLGDRFGDYGMIGTALSELHDDELGIVELALSCRAMGRRVEDALLEEVIGHAADSGMRVVSIEVTRTSRNQQIFEALTRVGFAPDRSDADGIERWSLELAESGRAGRDFAPWFTWDVGIDDLD
jgi:FkbH-like protein